MEKKKQGDLKVQPSICFLSDNGNYKNKVGLTVMKNDIRMEEVHNKGLPPIDTKVQQISH